MTIEKQDNCSSIGKNRYNITAADETSGVIWEVVGWAFPTPPLSLVGRCRAGYGLVLGLHVVANTANR